MSAATRNQIINRASSDLFDIVSNHDPEVHNLNNRVWDRLDQMAKEIEAHNSSPVRNWDEEGHTADAIRDAMLAIGKGVISFDKSRDAASLIIAHVSKFRPAQPIIPADATPEMIDAGLTTGSRFGRSAMANIWRTMHRAAGR